MATPTLIHGIASSQVLDSSGERIDIANLDISSYRQGKGTLNFEHESKLPQQNVGKIIYAKKIMTPEECSNDAQKKFWAVAKSPYVYVIGELFDSEGEHEAAKAIAATFKHDFKKSTKDEKHEYVYGFSVEGQTLEKKGSEIVASVARDLTITKKPCNKTCVAELYIPEADKSEEDPLEFLKSEPETYNLFKTLTAGGSNAAPSSLTGGASLASEQMDGKLYGRIKNFISRRVKASEKDKEGVSKALYSRIMNKAEDAMEQLASLAKADDRNTHVKGVNTPRKNRPSTSGRSSAGDVYRNSVQDRNDYNSQVKLANRSSHIPNKNIEHQAKIARNVAIGSHKKVLSDLQRMPKPDLGKSSEKESLSKDQNDWQQSDWQKEGYYLKHSSHPHPTFPDTTVHQVLAYDKTGECVGSYVAHDNHNGKLVGEDIDTTAKHRSKGLATAGYDLIEDQVGKFMHPSPYQLEDGAGFWQWRGVPNKNTPEHPNAQKANLGKKENLEKASWNVREQRKRIFGDSGEPSPDKKTTKPYFQAQTEALNRLAQKRYGLPLVGSQGKFQYTLKQINRMRSKKGEAPLTLDEVANHPDYELANTNVSSKKDFDQIRLKDQKSNPKPDWRGFKDGIETQRHIGAKAHEMGHLDIAPAGLGIGDIQHDMDEGSKIVGRQYGGSAKQTELEIQPMAAEERLRRRAGLPQFGRPQHTDPTRGKSSQLMTEQSPERVSLDTGRKYARRETDPSGQIYDRIGMGSNLSPENKQRMEDIDQGIVNFSPEKGWQPSLSSNALINLRAQGRPDEAKQRLKQKFSKNEKKPEPKLPYSQQQWYKMPIRQKKQAIAHLERERKGVKTPSIHEIFTQDVIDSIVNKHKQKPNG